MGRTAEIGTTEKVHDGNGAPRKRSATEMGPTEMGPTEMVQPHFRIVPETDEIVADSANGAKRLLQGSNFLQQALRVRYAGIGERD
jgi:hypothetical protein